MALEFWYGAVLLGAYLIGSIPFGYLIGRMHGKDIRKLGSGNIGATNVVRVIGKWQGRGCFLLDFLKGFAPVWIVGMLAQRYGFDTYGVAQLIATAGVVLGHMFTCFLNFKGGKGVATAAGAAFAIAPLALVCAFSAWAVVYLLSRYVSLASIVAAGLLPVLAVIFSLTGVEKQTLPVLGFFFLLGALAIWKHRSNIKRLREGTENRFSNK